MSRIEHLEIFCNNQDCGEPKASGGLHPVIVRSYRKMNYMGTVKMNSLGMTAVVNLLGIPLTGKTYPPGIYHKYQYEE